MFTNYAPFSFYFRPQTLGQSDPTAYSYCYFLSPPCEISYTSSSGCEYQNKDSAQGTEKTACAGTDAQNRPRTPPPTTAPSTTQPSSVTTLAESLTSPPSSSPTYTKGLGPVTFLSSYEEEFNKGHFWRFRVDCTPYIGSWCENFIRAFHSELLIRCV